MSTKKLTRNAPAQVQTLATKSATYEGYVVGSTKITAQRSKSVIMHKVDQTALELTRKTVTRFCQCMHLFFFPPLLGKPLFQVPKSKQTLGNR